jgi:phosphotransferase system enzyme I (PtsI)
MCGEMAGEPLYAYVLLGLGVDEWSMNATSIPRVKRILRKSVAYEAREFVGELLAHATAADIAGSLMEKLGDLFPEERF